MADLLSTGAAFVEASRKASMSSTVLYSRGAQSVSLAATRARAGAVVDEAGGIVQDARAADWLIGVTDLELGGSATVPARGDRIALPTGEVFEVNAPEGGEVWQYLNSYRRTIIAHSVQVSP